MNAVLTSLRVGTPWLSYGGAPRVAKVFACPILRGRDQLVLVWAPTKELAKQRAKQLLPAIETILSAEAGTNVEQLQRLVGPAE